MGRPWRYVEIPSFANTLEKLRAAVDRALKQLETAYNAGVEVRTETAAFTARVGVAYLVDATGGAVTVTLPQAAASRGKMVHVQKIDAGANAVTLDGFGAETIDGAATVNTTTQWAGFTVISNGTSWFTL